jgi:hypothetical protein
MSYKLYITAAGFMGAGAGAGANVVEQQSFNTEEDK